MRKSATELIKQFASICEALPPDALKAIDQELHDTFGHLPWVPLPGPQRQAVETEADELFFGGQAGGSKTDLLIGLSLTRHKRALILRRTNKEAIKLNERLIEILGSRDGFNGHDGTWHLPDGRIIDIGGCQLEDDKQKFKGSPHDGIFWDEVSDFSETQFRFVNAWNRSTDPEQRCRIVAAGNPPTQPSGLWVLKYWGPWLDKTHPNPAKPGELRWFTTIAGKDHEVEGPGPHNVDGEWIRARSRTFIPSSLADNAFLAGTGYDAVLAALPPELRAAYRDGNFDASVRDDDYQLLPTAWILAAQERWRKSGGRPPAGTRMTAIAADIAQGGGDQTVLAPRYDYWYAPLVVVDGSETPMGSDVAGLIVKHRRDGASIICDVGGGYAGGTLQVLKDNGFDAIGFNGAAAGPGRTNDAAKLSFGNKRALAYWRFREALDPDQPGGSPVALPDDPALRADLAASHWKMTTRGILIESKEDIKKRIGRSPDRGDAVVMCWDSGQSTMRDAIRSRSSSNHRDRPKFANLGYGDVKAKNRRRRGQ